MREVQGEVREHANYSQGCLELWPGHIIIYFSHCLSLILTKQTKFIFLSVCIFS